MKTSMNSPLTAGMVLDKPLQDQRKQNSSDGTSLLCHVLMIRWVFWFLPVLTSATEGKEENTTCPGFSWSRVDLFFFLQCLVGCYVLALGEKHWWHTSVSHCCWTVWYRTKDISISHLLILFCQQGAGGHKLLGGDITRTALSWTGQRDISCHNKKNYKTEGNWLGEGWRWPASAWDWLDISQQVVSNWMRITCFVNTCCILNRNRKKRTIITIP